MAGWPAPAYRAGRRPRRRDERLMLLVSRTRCSVKRCSAEPGPTATWTPDQQRTTPQVRRAAQHPGNARSGYSRVTFSRSAFPTTLTDDSAIAAAAMIGDSSNPKAG